MDGRLRISKTIKLLKKFNGQQLGMIRLRGLIGIYITSNEKAITSILSTLGGIGIIREVSQFQFLIDTEVDIDSESMELLEDKPIEGAEVDKILEDAKL